MTIEVSHHEQCESCLVGNYQPSFFEKYREFLFSFSTLVTIANGFLLLAGAITGSFFSNTTLANIFYIAATLVAGFPILLTSIRGVMEGDLTADLMVSVAMVGALLIGEYSAAALVVFMLMLGELLEDATVARADNALKALASLIPAKVTLLQPTGPAVVPVDQVRVGDVLMVRNGERIPVDGVITSGQAAVDEATITGESIPVDKQVGDTVFAGTLNTAGVIELEAQKLGRDTTLGTVIKLVEEAQKTQAPVQRLANRYAQYLVPVVFAISALTYFLTGESARAVTVLVVVCPCALVLATPTALVAAIGNAARHHVIVKDGAHMERLGNVDVVAFDKTGTVTEGHPEVVEVIALDTVPPDAILRFAASAESVSEHPLGRAIVDAADAKALEVLQSTDAQVFTGLGVQVTVEGRQVVVGNRAFLDSAGIALDEAQESRMVAEEMRGRTVVPVAVDQQLVGLIALADSVRSEARGALQALKAAGVQKTVLISGDNRPTVEAVAEQLGVDAFYAQTLPDQKLDLIKEMQAEGLQVAYVGDGVNDAPALATADIGIAMGVTGTDVAIEAADIALMRDDMQNLPFLMDLSVETLRTIKICVIFSMSVNLLSLFLSTNGVIGPAFGALMHEFSALPVLAYSARLVSYRS